MNNEITEYLEKYLLAIWDLNKKDNNITLQDVSSYLNISENNSLEAIKTLEKLGYINNDFTLTKKGEDTAELKHYRHTVLAKFLNGVLEIDETTAHKNATKMEYALSEEVLVKVVHFLDYIESCTNERHPSGCNHSNCGGCGNCNH